VPTLSVLVLNYNYRRYLRSCVESILAQTFGDFELIIIDDRSTDDSIELINELKQLDPRIVVAAHEKNQGFSRSLIEGTEELSRGELLTVISADDRAARNDAFATQVELLRKHPSAAFCFSGYDLFSETSSQLVQSFPAPVVADAREAMRLLLDNQARPAHSGVMIRASAYRASGGYRRDLRMAIDTAMWLALAVEGGFVYTPESLYGYRVHDKQMSAALAGVRRSTKEVREIFRTACDHAERRGCGTGGQDSAAFLKHFADYITHEARNRGRQVAATRLLAVALESPLAAASSRRLWLSALQTAIGPTAYDGLHRLLVRS